MIRVRKPREAPAVLVTKGLPLRDAMIAEARRGADTFEFDRSLYGHATVKRSLLDAQYDKCAFCEAKITHVAHGDVEHFRPKAGVLVGGRLVRPGYFWLAYEWGNLYASCAICNQRHKGSAFPISGRRAGWEDLDTTWEMPVFIDPGEDFPEEDIEFIDSAARGRTERGRVTVEALGLNREPLDARRRERVKLYRLLLDSLQAFVERGDPSTRANEQEIVTALCEAMRDDAEYAAMSRCLIRAHPLASRVLAAC